MQALIDIVGAIFVGAFLLLIAMTAMNTGLQTFVSFNADAIVQNELADLARIIQEDLRKMGYGIPPSQQSNILQIAQGDELKFIANLNMDSTYPGYAGIDSTPDTIHYTVAVHETITILDTSIVLYGVTRKIHLAGKSAQSIQIGTIANSDVFQYFNQVGQPVGTPLAARMVEVTIIALSPDIYMSDELIVAEDAEDQIAEINSLIRQSFWRQTRVISKNLRR